MITVLYFYTKDMSDFSGLSFSEHAPYIGLV